MRNKMYNLAEASKNSLIEYWESQPTDQPWLLNGFKGTWAISDHSLIPAEVMEFLLESFRNRLGEMRKSHIKIISLDEINDLLNEVWEGPGSVSKIVNLTYDMRQSRYKTDPASEKDPLKGYNIPTIESNLGENVVDKLED